jgi:hypothetical protein
MKKIQRNVFLNQLKQTIMKFAHTSHWESWVLHPRHLQVTGSIFHLTINKPLSARPDLERWTQNRINRTDPPSFNLRS